MIVFSTMRLILFQVRLSMAMREEMTSGGNCRAAWRDASKKRQAWQLFRMHW
jgi:hypothetical protein